VTENDDQRKITRTLARRRMVLEALVLFVFAWIAAIVVSLNRPASIAASTSSGFFYFVASTFLTGIECFVFGYVLSRFFKQFKTGCAFVIILFFAYLIWAGRQPL
jgi:hypothetical protein